MTISIIAIEAPFSASMVDWTARFELLNSILMSPLKSEFPLIVTILLTFKPFVRVSHRELVIETAYSHQLRATTEMSFGFR